MQLVNPSYIYLEVKDWDHSPMDIKEIRRKRLRQLIDERFNGRQANLSRVIDKQPDYISRCLKGTKGIGEDFARTVEIAVGLPHHWMDTDDNGVLPQITTNVEEVRYKVPVVSWVRAGEFCESPDLYAPGVAEETFRCNYKPGRHTYALRVVGDSMEPRFPEGCVLIVEPDATMNNGSFVIAKYDGQVTFKKAVLDGTQWWLRPLNPVYESIKMTEDTHICGVVKKFYFEGDV